MIRPPRLILIEPSGSHREVTLPAAGAPFRIGRQADNELPLRDTRISRRHSQILRENDKFILQDLESRHGTFVNGLRIPSGGRHELRPRDTIEFGVPDSYRLVFLGEEVSLDELMQSVEAPPPEARAAGSRELYHLGLLLEVARAFHTGMTLEDVLAAVVDAAIQLTGTERGVLLLEDPAGALAPAVARDARRTTLDPAALEISSSVLRSVQKTRKELIVTDMGQEAEMAQQGSVARLQLHAVVAIPVLKLPVMATAETTINNGTAELLGVLYLDSHAAGKAFTDLDRQVLRSLALETARVIENARLFAAARAKERMDHELALASQIQRQLLPRKFPHADYCAALGLNLACEAIGGDFYDVIELSSRRMGFVVADVSGKGISAALLASMLQGVFSATASMDIAVESVAGRVNRYLYERSGEERYVTLFYGVLDPGGRFEYLNAGHVPPLVRTAAGEVHPLEADNYPLGLFDHADFHSERVVLAPGDFVVVYTDGITEAQNMAGDMFGQARLAELLRGFTGKTAEELAQAIQAGVAAFTCGAPQADDFTMLIFHYTGKAA